MELFPAAIFVKIVGVIDRHYEAIATAVTDGPRSPATVISERDRKSFGSLYRNISFFCARLELGASLATVRKMLACLDDPNSKYADFFGLGPELAGRIKDEMEEREYFALSLKEAEHYKEPRGTWEAVIARFPDTIGDIEEARRRSSTACRFSNTV
jgi:hypothetical protein